MKPMDVRRRVLEDHERLREMLRALEELAGKVAGGAAHAAPTLRERGLELHAKLCEHLELEDQNLGPLLLECLGPEAAEQLSAEHREQRLLFEYILDRLRATQQPTILLARQLQSFVTLLYDDMAHEEEMVLRDEELRDA